MKNSKLRALIWFLLAAFSGLFAVAFYIWSLPSVNGTMLLFISALEASAAVACLVIGVQVYRSRPPMEQLPVKVPRHTVAVDFDGVLHSYESPWINAHTIPDPPVPGAIDWLWEMSKHFDILVHTTRGKTARGRFAVREYLAKNGYDGPLTVSAWKGPALVYIDDRGLRFDGTNFPTREEIHQLRPWNKPRVTKVPA